MPFPRRDDEGRRAAVPRLLRVGVVRQQLGDRVGVAVRRGEPQRGTSVSLGIFDARREVVRVSFAEKRSDEVDVAVPGRGAEVGVVRAGCERERRHRDPTREPSRERPLALPKVARTCEVKIKLASLLLLNQSSPGRSVRAQRASRRARPTAKPVVGERLVREARY